MGRRIVALVRWMVCWVIVFILQKLYFVLCTNIGNTGVMDVFQVVWHGLKLDMAALGYLSIIPFLFYLILPEFKSKCQLLKCYYLLLAAVSSLIFVADAALYPFWQFKLDTSVFLYLDKPGDALASVSAWFIMWRILHIFVWMCLFWKLACFMKLFPEENTKPDNCPLIWKTVLGRTSVVLVFVIVFILMIRGGLGKGTNNVSAAYYSSNQYLNHCAVNPVFNMIYTIGKDEDFGSIYQFFEEKKRAEYIKGIYNTDSKDTEKVLKTERPDILLIVWEGCCEYMYGKPGVTPCLGKLSEEGIDFTSCVANSFRTDRGLVSIMAGFPGLTQHSLMKIPEKSDFMPAFPRSLRDNGYETTFWYGGDISFTNMGGYMCQAGFGEIISDKDFTYKEKTSDWGVPDEILLSRVVESMLTKKNGKPQLNAVMTLSSHEPWDVSTSRLKDEKENAFNYTDECIGKALARLKKSPIWNNLLVIITADHGLSGLQLPRYDSQVTHIPMVWTGGAVSNRKKVEVLMNQSDLAATLLGQLSISHKDFIFSRDVLSNTYIYPTATFCYNNGVMFQDSTGCTVYDNDAGKVIKGTSQTRELKAKATLQTVYSTVGKIGRINER